MLNREPPMKVLICNFESLQTPSGVASFAIKLLRHLPCMQALTTRNVFQTPLEEREENLGAKTRYNEIFWMKPSKFILMNSKIREADLIHLNPFNFSELILLVLAKLHGRKCIATMHSNIDFHFLTPTIGLEIARLMVVYHLMLFLADGMVFLTGAHYRNYRKYSLLRNRLQKKAVVIPNAIESQRIAADSRTVKSPLTCIFVGRFEKRKGIDDVLRLAERLRPEEIQFRLVGYGPLQHPEEVAGNVKIIGRVPNEDLFRYYDQCQILFFPSYTEAFGITILEGMARGLVLLISDIPGIREFVQEGRNGYLFPPGNIEKMKELFLFLKQNPGEIERISRNNLADARQFTVERQAEKYLEVYHAILGHDQSPL
jgi:glycosyltransferase involved in cell wall biosynthesis